MAAKDTCAYTVVGGNCVIWVIIAVDHKVSRALQKRKDQQDTLRKCKVPSLVLCGQHDQLCPVKRHTFMAELIPHAELVVLENSGHLPPLEQPGETTAALRRWMKMP